MIGAIIIALVLIGSSSFVTALIVTRNIKQSPQKLAAQISPTVANVSPPTVAPTSINLPAAIQLVDSYQPTQEYTYVTWKSQDDPSNSGLSPLPDSYAEFDLCFGAGGSGCSTVLYSLAIYDNVSDIAGLTQPANSKFEWFQVLGHCVLQAGNDVHSDFLSVENDFSQIQPC